MKFSRTLQKLTLSLASVGLIVPQTGIVMAAETVNAAVQQQNIHTIADVALNAESKLIGQLVDRHGKPQVNKVVTVSTVQGEVVGKATTNEQGIFAVTVQKGGVYTVAGSEVKSAVRLWKEQAAPPAANQAVMLVDDASVVRGQTVGVDSQTNTRTFGPFARIAFLTGVVGLATVMALDVADQNSGS